MRGINFDRALKVTELGQEIVEARLAEIAKQQAPLGKLLRWRHAEEVGERDGQDGRRLWCTIGNFIYDITGGFPSSRV